MAAASRPAWPGFLARSAVLGIALLASSTARAAGPVAAELRAADAPAAQLEPTGSTGLPGGTVVYRYQQQVGGVDVLGAQAVVADSPGAPPLLVTDATRTGVGPQPGPTVSRARALAVAWAAGDVRTLRSPPQAELVVAPADDALAWRVVLPTRRPLADLQVLVDATSGTVLSKRDLLQNLKGQARLYDPNPVAMNGGYSGLGSTPSADHNDQDTALLTSLRRAEPLRRIQKGQTCLTGRYVRALLHRSRDPVCRQSLDWRSTTRSGDQFEAVMAYFHIDRTQHYIQSLGFNNVDNRRQVVLADSLNADNSFYSPGNKEIRYGSGGVDDAEDGDVIVHEYGHSIQDNQVPGFGGGATSESGALGEGFGDYLSATMTYQAPGLSGYDTFAGCVFDWDGVSGYNPDTAPCGRTADDPSTLLQAKVNCQLEIHCVGQVWSSTLLDLRGTLGGQVLDTDLIASQFLYAPNETFAQAAHHLECADETQHPAGAGGDCQGQNYAAIHAEMQDRAIE